jgi:uncharacterized protein YrzB (UPF0473 family)
MAGPAGPAEIKNRRKKKMNQYPENRPEEEEDDLIELVDEDGETTRFEHLATLEYKGESYLALCDPDADENDENGLEVFILKIETDEQGQDIRKIKDEFMAEFQKEVSDMNTKLNDILEEQVNININPIYINNIIDEIGDKKTSLSVDDLEVLDLMSAVEEVPVDD